MFVKQYDLSLGAAPYQGVAEIQFPNAFARYWESERDDKYRSYDEHGNPNGHRNTEAHDENSRFFMTPEMQLRTKDDYPAGEWEMFTQPGTTHVSHSWKSHAPIMHGYIVRINQAGRFVGSVDLFPDIYHRAWTNASGGLEKQWGANDLRFRMAWKEDGKDWEINQWTNCITGKVDTYEQEFTLRGPADVIFQFQIPIAHTVNGMIASQFSIYESMSRADMMRLLMQQQAQN